MENINILEENEIKNEATKNELDFIAELEILLKKYNVSLYGNVTIDDYFMIQKAFLENKVNYLTSKTYVKSNLI